MTDFQMKLNGQGVWWMADANRKGGWLGQHVQSASKWIALCCLCAGIGILVYLLLIPRSPGIPGWQPVNDALRVTLAEAAEPDPAVAPSPQTSQGASADSSLSQQELPPARLYLNRATAIELQSLPGIGPAKAQAIVDYREARGGFQRIEDLLQVKGIGPKIYEKIAPLVTLEEEKG